MVCVTWFCSHGAFLRLSPLSPASTSSLEAGAPVQVANPRGPASLASAQPPQNHLPACKRISTTRYSQTQMLIFEYNWDAIPYQWHNHLHEIFEGESSAREDFGFWREEVGDGLTTSHTLPVKTTFYRDKTTNTATTNRQQSPFKKARPEMENG